MLKEIRHYPLTRSYEKGDVIKGFDGQYVLLSRGVELSGWKYKLPEASLDIFTKFMNGDLHSGHLEFVNGSS
jgi:hypothetical protein